MTVPVCHRGCRGETAWMGGPGAHRPLWRAAWCLQQWRWVLRLVTRQCDGPVMTGTLSYWGKWCLMSSIIKIKINKTPSTPWRAEGCVSKWARVRWRGKEHVWKQGGWKGKGGEQSAAHGRSGPLFLMHLGGLSGRWVCSLAGCVRRSQQERALISVD